MSVFQKFNDFVEQLGKGVHQLHAAGHTLKVYLSNELPLDTDTVKADISEITPASGYSAGGEDVQNDYSETGGVATLTCQDITWTAGATIGPFRYAILYNDSVAGDPLIGFWDYGSAITLLTGQEFKIDFGAAVLILT